MSTVKCLIVVAIKQQWPLFQLDINNAFLHGELDEEVFMKLPPILLVPSSPDCSFSDPSLCKLQKSLYGLRQASRQWYAKLSQPLEFRGYHHSLNDYSLFTGGSGDSFVVGVVSVDGDSFVVGVISVDDTVLTGTDLTETDALKPFLHDPFKIKDLGLLNYFLGIEVSYTSSGVLLHQKKFIADLLKKVSL